MITRIYKGLRYTEVSRSAYNVIIRAYAPKWWLYTTTITIPIDVWEELGSN